MVQQPHGTPPLLPRPDAHEQPAVADGAESRDAVIGIFAVGAFAWGLGVVLVHGIAGVRRPQGVADG